MVVGLVCTTIKPRTGFDIMSRVPDSAAFEGIFKSDGPPALLIVVDDADSSGIIEAVGNAVAEETPDVADVTVAGENGDLVGGI